MPEEITASDTLTDLDACFPPTFGNTLVSMTNLTPFDFTEVWYVADPETLISNVDGLVNGEEAFRIDSVGINTPLVFESLVSDGIFQAGEFWDFIIDDYANTLGIPASAFSSPSLVGTLSLANTSSGSIIATRVPVPEPSTLFLFGVGLTGVAFMMRRRRDLCCA